MPLEPRKAECDICGKVEQEKNFGDGFMGWYFLVGMQKNGADVATCPGCSIKVKSFVIAESLVGANGGSPLQQEANGCSPLQQEANGGSPL